MTNQELVALQEAVFIVIANAYPDLERNPPYVDYDVPIHASFWRVEGLSTRRRAGIPQRQVPTYNRTDSHCAPALGNHSAVQFV